MTKKRLAFTLTTKLKCRHNKEDFEKAFLFFLMDKDVWINNLAYWCEFSKNTKWHCHGIIDEEEKWEISKDDEFFTYFKPIFDENKWLGYCKKSELDMGIPEHFASCIEVYNADTQQ